MYVTAFPEKLMKLFVRAEKSYFKENIFLIKNDVLRIHSRVIRIIL